MTSVVTRARTEQISEKNDVNSLLSAFVSVYCAYNEQDSKNLSAKGDFVQSKRVVVK